MRSKIVNVVAQYTKEAEDARYTKIADWNTRIAPAEHVRYGAQNPDRHTLTQEKTPEGGDGHEKTTEYPVRRQFDTK